MQSRRIRLSLAALIALAGIAVTPAAAPGSGTVPPDPADQPPFDGGKPYQLSVPPSEYQPPPGFSLDAQRVAGIATASVDGDLADQAQRVRVRTRLGDGGRNQWQARL